MSDKTPESANPEAAVSAGKTVGPRRRHKPSPGRHGTGKTSGIAASAAALATPAIPAAQPPKLKAKSSRGPSAAAVPASSDTTKPPAGGALTRQPSKVALAKQALGPLSIEDTIAATTALAVLRGPFTIVHVETAGPDPLRDEILSIHAMQVDRHRPVAEFCVRVLPLCALPDAIGADGEQDGRPPAKKHGGVPLQEAVKGLRQFLGTHRRHVFVHGAAHTQTFLGQAARQYGMLIENPVGDVVDLARLAWPDRSDYSLSGLVGDLPPGPRSVRTASDASKAILELLMEASKHLTINGGRVSLSIGYWGKSASTFTPRPSPW